MGSSLVLCLAISMLLGSVSTPDPVLAQGASTNSPIGRWKTVDDATGKVKSVVTIWEEAGKLYGRIQKLVDPDPKDPNPRCTPCTGEQKGHPVIGLRILWDLQKDGEEMLKGTKDRKLISFHDSLRYFAKSYGLTIVALHGERAT